MLDVRTLDHSSNEDVMIYTEHGYPITNVKLVGRTIHLEVGLHGLSPVNLLELKICWRGVRSFGIRNKKIRHVVVTQGNEEVMGFKVLGDRLLVIC